jgi:hypothetical protein
MRREPWCLKSFYNDFAQMLKADLGALDLDLARVIEDKLLRQGRR